MIEDLQLQIDDLNIALAKARAAYDDLIKQNQAEVSTLKEKHAFQQAEKLEA